VFFQIAYRIDTMRYTVPNSKCIAIIYNVVHNKMYNVYSIIVNEVVFGEVMSASLKLFPADAAISLVSDLQLLTLRFPS